ncbi:MAG TPA: hypothetical protein VM409_08635 [Chloroflexia bacterium]|nr:hypothetical protein [Chloroflexia bacterium]
MSDPDSGRLRRLISWSPVYEPAWDLTPDSYLEGSLVGWGRSRRLGLFRQGQVKAYLGVQHIDPSKPGWGFIEQPECRFFLSLFIGPTCVTLRTFPSMPEALDHLSTFLESVSGSR